MKLLKIENVPANPRMLLGFEYEDFYSILEFYRKKNQYFFAHLDKKEHSRWKRGIFYEEERCKKTGRALKILKVLGDLDFKEVSGEEFLTHDQPVVRHIAKAYIEGDQDWIHIFRLIVNLEAKKMWGKLNFRNALKNSNYDKGKSLKVWHV